MQTSQIIGIAMASCGILTSVATFIHDVRRGKVAEQCPQAAPKRIPPEVHALALVLSGIGIGLSWGWGFGLGASGLHLAMALAVNRLVG